MECDTDKLLKDLRKEANRYKEMNECVRDLENMTSSVFPYEFHEDIVTSWVKCWNYLENSKSMYKRKLQRDIIHEIMKLKFITIHD